MRKEDSWWQCECGRRVRLPAGDRKRKKVVCPQCGATMGKRVNVPPEVTASDTQMVNIAEMARMAQEGLDVGASGEWDTVPGKDPKSRRGKKD